MPNAHCAGVVLDREVDVSRGDWLLALVPPAPAAIVADDDFADTPTATSLPPSREISTTVAWMDDESLITGRVCWVRWCWSTPPPTAQRGPCC